MNVTGFFSKKQIKITIAVSISEVWRRNIGRGNPTERIRCSCLQNEVGRLGATCVFVIDKRICVGVTDEQYGEEIKAFVSLKEDEPDIDGDRLREFCRENMSATKYPRLFEILPDLPKGPTGKILRKELRAREKSSER